MIAYDPNKTLIFLHIPKTAGTSVRDVFKGWFGDRMRPHYPGGPGGQDLVRAHQALVQTQQPPPVLYGHFNGRIGRGVSTDFPQVRQLITILRDPLEQVLSGYFYVKQRHPTPEGYPAWASPDLETHILNPALTFRNHFPAELSRDNYKDILEERFIEIGLTEQLDLSLARIAQALGKPFDTGSLPWLNKALRDQDVPEDLRARFIETHALDYEIYAYVKARF